MGLDVSVVELATAPLTRVLGEEAGGWFRDYHSERGVTLYCGVSVVSASADDRGTTLKLSDGTVLIADLVVAGIGVAPATGWLEGSGLTLSDGIACDPALRTSAPGVVAAGDIVRWRHQLFDETIRVEQWLNAVEQGAHAARTLLGEAEPFTHVPYFWSDQFDAMVRFVGRGTATDCTEIKRVSDRGMVALFGRNRVLEGALCINAPRHLAKCKVAIQKRHPWAERADLL
jgi:NADPH-dependent 2,4-dienoyl-CoA reductase/sulfur reductase-like enzyme